MAGINVNSGSICRAAGPAGSRQGPEVPDICKWCGAGIVQLQRPKPIRSLGLDLDRTPRMKKCTIINTMYTQR